MALPPLNPLLQESKQKLVLWATTDTKLKLLNECSWYGFALVLFLNLFSVFHKAHFVSTNFSVFFFQTEI